jgi:hypothetical protein
MTISLKAAEQFARLVKPPGVGIALAATSPTWARYNLVSLEDGSVLPSDSCIEVSLIDGTAAEVLVGPIADAMVADG